ncbi:MAG: amidohydrolase family protein, partial [Betaproteobacteria bacterium]
MSNTHFPSTTGLQAFRASILHFLGEPDSLGKRAHEYVEDGLLVIKDGRVQEMGPAQALLPSLPAGLAVIDYRGRLIMPGFVDTHIHFAQADIVASHGEQVLEWLERYTFPEERRFADDRHVAEVAEFSVNEMLRNGTTTSMVFAT